jgi:hypothetical protein
MANNTNEVQNAMSDAFNRAESTQQRLTDATKGIIEDASSAQQRFTEATKGMLEDASKFYQSFFSMEGSRRVAEVYIETTEKMANEAIEFNRRLVQLSAGAARRFWQVAEEQRSQIYTH